MNALVLVLLFVRACSAEPGIDAKLRYERAIESRVEALLEEILGPRKVRVFIEATLDQSMTEEMVAKAAEDAEQGETLPGYRPPRTAKRVWAPKDPVKKLAVTVVADPRLSPPDIQGVINTITEVLGLDSARGDTLRVARAPMAPTLMKTLADPELRKLAAMAAVLGCVLLLMLPMFLAVLRRAGLRWARPFGGESWLASVPVIHGTPLPPPSGALALPMGSANLELGFMRARHLKSVARFLEGRPPAAARWVLGSLDAERAAALFAMLSDRLRDSAASDMLQGAVPSPAEFERLEEELRQFVSREDTGPGLLQRLLVRSHADTRQGVIEFLRARLPGPARAIEAGLVTFDDLARVDAQDLRTLAQVVTSEEWTLALQGASPGLKDYILSALPAVFRERIDRRLQASAGLSADAGAAARAAIVGRWKDLEASGKVRPIA